jgi:hypothetical protein
VLGGPAVVLGLQRSAGNAAVARAIARINAPERTMVSREPAAAETADAQPAAEAQSTGPGKGARKTGASGLDALKALSLLQTAAPLRMPAGAMGDVLLVPGANVNGKILLSAAPLQTFYIDGNDVWEAYTPDFVRDLWMTAFVDGVKRAEWLLPIAKAEMALIEGFLGPWYVMLGLGVLEAVHFYDEHRSQLKQTATALKVLNDARAQLKQRYPTLHDRVLAEALKDAVFAMGEGIGLDDIAYLVGRVLGTQGLLGKHIAGVEITLKVVAKIVAEYAVLIAILHGPKMVGAGLDAAAKSSAAKLKEHLAAAGIDVSEEDAARIAKELAADPSSKAFLEEIGAKAGEATRLLQDITKLNAGKK